MAVIQPDSRIFIAGHRGLVGGALVRALTRRGHQNLLLKSRAELDLLDQRGVHDFFLKEKPDYVIVAAAKVGGILYNSTYPADFLYENLVIATNVMKSAADSGVKKLLYLGSSCIYPKFAAQPIKEEYLLAGPLESSNEGYALAKIAGLKLCEKFRAQYGKDFISAMPTNLYGEGDNFHPDHSHVIPGMLRRFHEAKVKNKPEVMIWGSGNPRREFLYVDDLAEGLLLLLEEYDGLRTINIGTGEDIAIRDLAELMKQITGYPGAIKYDISKPDGTPRKVLDVSRVKALGWAPKVKLEEGLRMTYQWALEQGKL